MADMKPFQTSVLGPYVVMSSRFQYSTHQFIFCSQYFHSEFSRKKVSLENQIFPEAL